MSITTPETPRNDPRGEGLRRFGAEARRRRLMVLDGRKPLTIRTLAGKLGVSPGYWSALENASYAPGRHPSRPSPDILRKAAEVLHYPLAEMLRDMGELDGVFNPDGTALVDKLWMMTDQERWTLLQAILSIEDEQRRGEERG